MHRTFFLIRRGVTPDNTVRVEVDSRVTYRDISERLTTEQVSARMDDTPLTEAKVAELFPEALAAAKAYVDMRVRVRFDPLCVGPFRITTEEEPTDEELVNVYHESRKTRRA